MHTTKAKKLLCLVLSLMMILGAVPLTAFAMDMSCEQEFRMTTIVNGKEPSDEDAGKFEFFFDELKRPGTSRPWENLKTAWNGSKNGNGDINFGKLTYSTGDEGVHWYRFYESQEKIVDYTPDKNVFYLKIIIEVVRLGEGYLYHVTGIDSYKSAINADVYDNAGRIDEDKLTACSTDIVFANSYRHDHVFSWKWTTNATAHWHGCMEDDCYIEDYSTCGITEAAYAEHTFVGGFCSVCGAEDTSAPVCTHENTIIKDKVDATCIAGGYTGDVFCIDCETTIEEGTATDPDPDNHINGVLDESSVVEATCDKPGYTGDIRCSGCHELLIEGTEVDPLSHNLAWDGIAGTDGQHTLKCSRCEYSEKVDCNIVNGKCSVCDYVCKHSFTTYVSNNDATCAADGTKTAECEYCDMTNTVTDTGTKLAHTFTNYVYNNDAKCGVNGTETAKCDNCTATDTREVANTALTHSFTYYVTDGNATCTADGTKTAKCDYCDVTDTVADTGSKLPHSFTNYIYNDDAKCGVNGTETSKCDNCNTTDTREAENTALAHDFTGEAKDNGDGTHSFLCVNGCGEYGDPQAHTGMEDFICDDCGYTDVAGQLAKAKEEAKKAIDEELNDDDTDEVKEIAENVKKAIDEADTLDEVKTEKDEGIEAIRAARNSGSDEPDGDACPKCGGHHGNSFFDRIVCLITRIITMLLDAFNTVC